VIGVTNNEPPEFSRIFDIEDLPDEVLEVDISATESERQALAIRFDLLSLDSLQAHLVLSNPGNKGDVKLSATFSAEVTQSCVVTLKPVADRVEGLFSCRFSEQVTEVKEEILEISVGDEAPPEPITNGKFDVGEIVIEHFGLELPPFPRQPGADFDEIKNKIKAIGGQENTDNPFAVLKKLK
jgi:uncharacterized metal-binding protein YceD (DUF177 family)